MSSPWGAMAIAKICVAGNRLRARWMWNSTPRTAAETSPIMAPGRLSAIPFWISRSIRRDVGWYVRQLEEVMIRAAAAIRSEKRSRSRKDRCLGAPTPRGCEETGSHWRAFEPLGHVARFCVQCLHGSSLFRLDRALRHRGSPRDFAGRRCWDATFNMTDARTRTGDGVW